MPSEHVEDADIGNLPKDIPVEGIKVVPVVAGDYRAELVVGQDNKVVATQRLEIGSVVGFYNSKVMTKEEEEDWSLNPPKHYSLSRIHWQHECNSYIADIPEDTSKMTAPMKAIFKDSLKVKPETSRHMSAIDSISVFLNFVATHDGALYVLF